MNTLLAMDYTVDIAIREWRTGAFEPELVEVQQRIVRRHASAPPLGYRPELCDGLAVARDRNALSTLGPSDESRQVGLGIVDIHSRFAHCY